MDLFYEWAPGLRCKVICCVLHIREKFLHFRIDIVHVALCVQENLGGFISQCEGRVFHAPVFKGV